MRQGEIDLKLNVMKNLVIFFLAFIFTSAGTFANVVEKASPMPDIIITISINLHTKASQCQTGFGFCRIKFGISWDSGENAPTGSGVSGQISLEANNQIIIKISESDLQKYENGGSLKYLKGKQTIYIDDSYEIPKDVSDRLGVTKPLVIKQGEYKIRYDGVVYSIVIPQ